MSDKDNPLFHIEFSQEATQELLGRQSVRTTFRLSERSIDALSVLARQLGIKQKSLFDHLIDDTRALTTIARQFEEFGTRQRVAKTYVISRRTLDNLEKVAEKFNTPRDALVEFSIERLLPLLAQEKKKHERRKQFLTQMVPCLEESMRLNELSRQLLGPDDPVSQEILAMTRAVQQCTQKIKEHVERGSRMEDI